MRKVLVGCAVACALLLAPAAEANLVLNGDFSAGLAGWTAWNAPWGNVTVTDSGCPNPGNPEPCAYHQVQGAGSGGLWQRIAVPIGVLLIIDADWTGDVSAPGWAELIVGEDPGVGNELAFMDGPAGPHVQAKKDGWGLNPPAVWPWQTVQLSPFGGSTFTHTSASGSIIVGTKAGANPGNTWACFDNIEVVPIPEPGTMVLLGSGLLGLVAFARRKFLA